MPFIMKFYNLLFVLFLLMGCNSILQEEITIQKIEAVTSDVPQSIFQLQNSISVQDYGAIGDGISDDTNAIIEALEEARDQKKTCYFPKTSSFYKISGTIRVLLDSSDSLVIVSNGAKVKPQNASYLDRSFFTLSPTFEDNVIFSIGGRRSSGPVENYFDDNAGSYLFMSGLVIEGPDQVFPENPLLTTEVWVGLQTSAFYLQIEELTVSDVYGYGIMTYGGSKIEINDVNCTSVGGRGQTIYRDQIDQDSFGDGIYCGFLKSAAEVDIEDTKVSGYDQVERRSRSGITFEYNPFPYTVNISNCWVSKFAKSIHFEDKGSAVININDCQFEKFNYSIAMVENNLSAATITNSIFNVTGTDGGDQGDGGPTYNGNGAETEFHNCEINLNGRNNAYVSIVGNVLFKDCRIYGNNKNPYFADESAVFEDCTFYNFGGAGHSFFAWEYNVSNFLLRRSYFVDCGAISAAGPNVTLNFHDYSSNNSNVLIPKNIPDLVLPIAIPLIWDINQASTVPIAGTNYLEHHRLKPSDQAVLTHGQSIYSQNGQYRLVMQTDGDLTLYKEPSHQMLWSSGSGWPGRSGTYALWFEHTGRLVVRRTVNGNTEDLWASTSYVDPHSQNGVNARYADFTVENNGNCVMYFRKDAETVTVLPFRTFTDGGVPSPNMYTLE